MGQPKSVVSSKAVGDRYEGETEVWKVIDELGSLLEKDRRLVDSDSRSPDFFICGAAKSGTTSLFNYLGQHPQIFTPKWKEPGYFSALRPLKSPAQYACLFEEAEESQIVGEASGAYLTSPDSAARIAQVAPQAKIIIMLRNPAERAFSLYRWMTCEGYEWIPTFHRALQEESRRRGNVDFIKSNPEYYYNFLYRTTGCYAPQIAHFLDYFGREQVRFFIFEDFAEHPGAYTKKAFRFLGLRDSIAVETPVRNRGKDVLSVRLQYWLRQKGSFAEYFPLGSRASKRAMRLNTVQRNRRLDQHTRERLLKFYEEDILRAGEVIGRDLRSLWL
jgi:hypothetical protein